MHLTKGQYIEFMKDLNVKRSERKIIFFRLKERRYIFCKFVI